MRNIHTNSARKVTKKNPYTQAYGLKNENFLHFATKITYNGAILRHLWVPQFFSPNPLFSHDLLLPPPILSYTSILKKIIYCIHQLSHIHPAYASIPCFHMFLHLVTECTQCFIVRAIPCRIVFY